MNVPYHKINSYLNSTSTRYSICISAIMFASYATGHGKWSSLLLASVCASIAVFMPIYARLSNKIEDLAKLKTASVSVGRICRFLPQLIFNAAVFLIFVGGGVVEVSNIALVGGIFGATIVTTLASQGAQYAGIFLANRGVGDHNRNVMIALSANIIVTAFGTAGLPIAKEIFLIGGIALGGSVFAIGVASDLRSLIYPQGGIGLFFGTFNPFHKTHLALIESFLVERQLDKIYIHPTILPKLHRDALNNGEIEVSEIDGGMQVYATTAKADVNVNYFPTGNRFFSPETRMALINIAIADAGLAGRVEVLAYPEIYAADGFHGVINKIRAQHVTAAIHGLHGSDVGGMLVRAIYDECGWIYPMSIRRKDGVSATAIRNGASGMTSHPVTQALQQLGENSPVIFIGNKRYSNHDGQLDPA